MTPRAARLASLVASAVFALAASDGLSSPTSGRGESRLVFPDPVVRAGRPLRVALERTPSGRRAALLASRLGDGAEWPSVGRLCLGPPLGDRNVIARTRSDGAGTARFDFIVPVRGFREGSLVHFQSVCGDPAFAEGTGISDSRALPFVPDALFLADGPGRSVRKVDTESGALLAPVFEASGRPRRLVHDMARARVHALVDGPPSRIVTLDAADAAALGSVSFDAGFAPDAFAFAALSSRFIAVETATGRLASAPVDGGASEIVTGTLPDGAFPVAGAIAVATAFGEFVILPHALRLTAAVVDPLTLEIAETIDLDPENAIDPGGLGALVGSRGFAAREVDGVATALFVAPLLVHTGGAVAVPVDLTARPFAAGAASGVFMSSGPITGLVATPAESVFALDSAGERLAVLGTGGGGIAFLFHTPVPDARPGLVRTDAARLVAATAGGYAPISILNPLAPLVMDAIESVAAPVDVVP